MARKRRQPTLPREAIDLSQNQHTDSESGSGIDTAPNTESSVSDCESGISGDGIGRPSSPALGFLEQNLISVTEGDGVYELIKRRLISGLGPVGALTSVEAIQKHRYASVGARVRPLAFQLYCQAMKQKCGGNANVRYAWCPTSKDDLAKVLSFGFGHSGKPEYSGLFGRGVCFSPEEHPLGSVKLAPIDKHGLRYLLLCRVILGKSELICPGSGQCHPSSEEFDSGVDDLLSPRKYVVWSAHMNTHILPEYIISFRAPRCLEGFWKVDSPSPCSPWVPFSKLISALSRVLPSDAIRLINNYYIDHRERRMPRHDLIEKVRLVAGDRLLMSVIKSFRAKHLRASNGLHEKRTENGFDNSVPFH